jgi:hypothetical protein
MSHHFREVGSVLTNFYIKVPCDTRDVVKGVKSTTGIICIMCGCIAHDQLHSEDVEEVWETIHKNYKDSAEEILQFRKLVKEQWISTKTRDLIANCKKLKPNSLVENGQLMSIKNLAYKEADKKVKKSARSNRRQYMNEKARQAEEAASHGDTRTVYRLTKETVGKSSLHECTVKNEGGRLLTDGEEQKERWASYFETLLNRFTSIVPPDIPDQPIFNLSISDDKPTADEILSAAKKLKNGKALGTVSISSVMSKSSLRRILVIWRFFFSLP